MNRKELNKLTKEELIEEYIDLQDDNAWWERRWKAEHRIAFEKFKPRIDKAIEYIKENINKQLESDYLLNRSNLAIYNKELLEILGDKENENN